MPIHDILLAVAIFVNGAKGHSALQLSRDLDCHYKTAFVVAHKIREAIPVEDGERTLSGEVEVDGAYFGGHVKPANNREIRRDRRLAVNQTGKSKVVVVMRERGGETLPLCSRPRLPPCRRLAGASRQRAPFMPTKPRPGIGCTTAS